MYTYAWYHWITFFFFYCFFGWIFESAYVSLKSGHFVNRGFLRLPMLPLYGTGAVMMLWVSLPVKDNLLLVYLSGVVAATILEYVTGYVMERLFKVKYWDYSNQRFNLHGYICLTSSIAWGFLTILMTEVIHRPVERLVLGMNPVVEFAFIGITGAMFIADSVQSTREALDLARALEAMTRMRVELEELQVQIALLKAEAADKAHSRRMVIKARFRHGQMLRAAVGQPGRVLRAAGGQPGRLLRAAGEQPGRLLRAAGEQPGRLLRAAGGQTGRLLKAAEIRSEQLIKTAEDQSGRLMEAAGNLKEATTQKLAELRAESHQRPSVPAELTALTERLRELTEKRQKLTRHMGFYRRGILRGNPGATSRRFADALRELRELMDER